VVSLPIAFASPSALADGDIPIFLDYQVHDSCPTEQAFANELVKRERRLTFVEGGIAKVSLLVQIEHNGEGYAKGNTGRVRVVNRATADPDAFVLERSVQGDTCADVARVLAVMGAMLLDVGIRAPVSESHLRHSLDAKKTPPLHGARAQPSDTTVPPVVGALVSAANSSKPSARLPVVVGMTTIVSSVFGGTAFGVGLFSELPLVQDAKLSARLLVTYVADSQTVPMGQANFSRIVGSASSCWMALQPESWLRVGPCVAIEICEIGARGSLQSGRDLGRTTAWWGSSGSALAQTSLTHWLLLELEGGATLSLTRHSFVFRDAQKEVPIRDMPYAGAWGRIGVGVRFN